MDNRLVIDHGCKLAHSIATPKSFRRRPRESYSIGIIYGFSEFFHCQITTTCFSPPTRFLDFIDSILKGLI